MAGLFDFMQPQQSANTPDFDIGRHLTAGAQSFANSGKILPALFNGLAGLVTGQRTDPAGQKAALFQAILNGQQPTGQANTGTPGSGAAPGNLFKLQQALLATGDIDGAKKVADMANQSQTELIRNYNYAKSQGFSGSIFDFETGIKKAGANNTSVDARQMGTIPPGFRVEYDANGRPLQMVPIAGSPAAKEIEDKAKAESAASENRSTSTDIVTGAASKAREAIEKSTLPATGSAGAILSNIGETGAAEVYRQVEAIKANAKIETLQAMRKASPTGGALGAVSDSENAMLAAKAGALDPKSPNFTRDLADYERSLLRVIHGKDAGDRAFNDSRQTAGWQDVGGVKIRKKQ